MGYDIQAEREEKERQAKRTAARQARIDRMKKGKLALLYADTKVFLLDLFEKLQEYREERKLSKCKITDKRKTCNTNSNTDINLCKCKDCGKEISKREESCPCCGASQRKKQRSGFGCGGCLAVIFFIFFTSTVIIPMMISSRSTKQTESAEKKVKLPAQPILPPPISQSSQHEVSKKTNEDVYTIIKKDKEIISGIVKGLFYVRLEKKVSEDFLSILAYNLKENDPLKYDRLFIWYFLPDMPIDSRAWAMTHFTPYLEVKILGMTNEEEYKVVNEKINSSDNILGEFIDEFEGKYILLRRDNKVILLTLYKDGGRVEEEMLVQKTLSGGIRLDSVEGNDFGEYFMIETDGNLVLYNGKHGLFRTIHPIK